MAFSPDGTTLATGLQDGAVVLGKVDGEGVTRVFGGHADWITSVAFSPDGRLLATGSGHARDGEEPWRCATGEVRLWDVETGQVVHVLEGDTDFVGNLHFSPDGTTLVSESWDGTVNLWQVEQGTLRRTFEPTAAVFRGGSIAAFSPDSAQVAVGMDVGTIDVWRQEDQALVSSLEGHGGAILSTAFSPDSSLVASSFVGNSVVLWRTSGGSIFYTQQYTGQIWSLAFSPDGKFLASSSWDGTTRLWGVLGAQE